MRLFQAALDIPLDSPFSATLSSHGLHFTVYVPSSDTHHFRRFRRSEEQGSCSQWVECKFVIFTVFVITALFWQGAKTRFTKNTVCATPTIGATAIHN